MVKPALTPLLVNFEKQISNSFDLFKSITDVKNAYVRSTPRLSQNDVNLVVELSFLKIFLANTFIKYMLGGKTKSGYKVRCYISPKNLNHALEIVCEGKPFPKWATSSEVIRKADLFFKEGKPFRDSLQPIISMLNDMQTIRNSLVHTSYNSEEKFKTLLRHELGYAQRNITTGKFLLTIKPSTTPPVTYLQFYTDSLKTAAKMITP